MDNYPPGVTGREPQITGEWPADALIDAITDTIKKVRDEVEELTGLLDDQGALSAREDNAITDAVEALVDELRSVENTLEPPDPEGV